MPRGRCPGLAGDFENHAVGELDAGAGTEQGECSGDDVGILEANLSVVEDHLDGGGDLSRLALVGSVKHPHRLNEHHLRHPGAGGNEPLASVELARLVTYQQAH